MYRMYDKKKIDSAIRKYRKEYPSAEISIGMRNDWFWTAEDIENKKDWKVISGKYYQIGGIAGSYIDTPVLSIVTEEGELLIDICKEVEDKEGKSAFRETRSLIGEELSKLLKEKE